MNEQEVLYMVEACWAAHQDMIKQKIVTPSNDPEENFKQGVMHVLAMMQAAEDSMKFNLN